ncbi:MAG: hypothetical protein AAFY08_16270, partial [Planctomycetota bacterium]
MIDPLPRLSWRQAGLALALTVAVTAVGCKSKPKPEPARPSSLDASREPAYGTATEREPVTTPISFEETTTTTTTTEVVEEREPTVLTI